MTKEERRELVLAKFKEWGLQVHFIDPAAAPSNLQGDIPLVLANGKPKLLLLSFSRKRKRLM